METKTKVIIGAIALAVTFALGRYTVPIKTVTEIKYVEVDKKVDQTDSSKKTHTTTTIVQAPDGSKTTTIVQDTGSTTKSTETEQKSDSSDTIKTVSRASNITISGLGGVDFTRGVPMYGLSVSRPILGPITAGAWLLTPGVVGVSLGLSF